MCCWQAFQSCCAKLSWDVYWPGCNKGKDASNQDCNLPLAQLGDFKRCFNITTDCTLAEESLAHATLSRELCSRPDWQCLALLSWLQEQDSECSFCFHFWLPSVFSLIVCAPCAQLTAWGIRIRQSMFAATMRAAAATFLIYTLFFFRHCQPLCTDLKQQLLDCVFKNAYWTDHLQWDSMLCKI